eukprot:scpid59526/ scgid20686/ 
MLVPFPRAASKLLINFLIFHRSTFLSDASSPLEAMTKVRTKASPQYSPWSKVRPETQFYNLSWQRQNSRRATTGGQKIGMDTTASAVSNKIASSLVQRDDDQVHALLFLHDG